MAPSTKAKIQSVQAKLSLPDEFNEPSDDLLDYFMMIFGRKNVGKSTFGSSIEESLNFQLERGRKNLSILMVPKKGEKPLTYTTFKQYIELFCEHKTLRMAIFDTIDAAYDLVYQDTLRSYGAHIRKPEDTGDSPGVWNEIKYKFDDLIAMVQDAGKAITFISHEKVKEHKNADGTVMERIEPSCSGQAMGVVQRYCDMVFHYDYVTNDRVLTIRNMDNTIWTSCGRAEKFLDIDGNPINRLKIPNDPTGGGDHGFDTLIAAFDGIDPDIRDYDYTPPKPAKTAIPKKTSAPAKTGTAKK